ncbi:hypothetical protein QR680_015084 [Steinernema hermaphroditum]|uniref:RING-type domain-containing protein n=1 Tax=Steinernema hermaphroditum TaxID=289476 RepID=A0AA39ICN9_9BILA|nr:hypothetical protein QR680_015084 [Steinernema hermaphroditum]
MLAGFLDRVRKRFNSDELPAPRPSRSASLSSSSSSCSIADDIPSTSAPPVSASPLTVRVVKSPSRLSRTSSRASKADRSGSNTKRRHTTSLEVMFEPAFIERILAKRHIKRLYGACDKEEDDLPEISIDECCLCRSRKATVCVDPCRHEIMCRKCAVHLIEISLNKGEDSVKCPICRGEVLGFHYRQKRSTSAAPLRKPRSPADSPSAVHSRSMAVSAGGTRSRIYCSSSSTSSSA